LLAKFHQNPRFWIYSVNFYRNSTHRTSPNFSSNYISNLEKFLQEKLSLNRSPFYPYFIWNFWSLVSFPFDQISLMFLKLIQINIKLYCSSGLGPSVLVSGRPTRARAPLIGRTHLSAAPLPSAVPRPTCQLLRSAGSVHTTHVARAHRIGATAVRAPLTGRQGPPPLLMPRVLHASAMSPDPHRPPCLTAPFQKGIGRRRRASARFSLLRPHSRHPAANLITVRPSHPWSTPFPHPNSGRSATTRSVSRRSSRFPIDLDPTSPHSLSPWCRARAPSSATTVPAPPPSTATAPHRPTAANLLTRRHPETPPVLAGSTLPPASPHRAAVERATARTLPRAARAVFPTGPSRQAATSWLFRPAARSRPPRSVGCSLVPVSAQTVMGI
jgi:hypothetical protein